MRRYCCMHGFTVEYSFGPVIIKLNKLRKILLMGFFMTAAMFSQAGLTVRIDFTPGTNDDYDIFFKKGFESEGYVAYVDYFERSGPRHYDLLFKYEWDDHTLKGSLYSNEGKLLRQHEEKILYLDRIESKTYQFLGELLGRVIHVKDRRGRIKTALGIVGVEKTKLDSAIYALKVLGSETMSIDLVQREFFKIATQLTGKFRTYFEGSYHQYEAGQAWLPNSQCIGWKVQGIIIGAEIQGMDYISLAAPPDEYVAYLDHLSQGVDFPIEEPGDNRVSYICIMRNSSKSSDYGPYFVYVDEKPVCNLNYKHYAMIPVSPGWHIVTVKSPDFNRNQKPLELQVKVEHLKNSYVSIIWSYHIGIMYQEVKKYEAKLLIQGLAKEACR